MSPRSKYWGDVSPLSHRIDAPETVELSCVIQQKTSNLSMSWDSGAVG